ncbi:MAG: hypothetical protein PHS52_07655 [Desulfotomaculaceae bacterium]|nr:hypothetical protein [Desulfotomaculaceae bacterium]
MKKKFLKLMSCFLVLLIISGCNPLISLKKPAEKPLVIKPEDFSVFLFESSEEIYRANVKSTAMWAGLREQADRDVDYAMHYKWLYDTYAKWDDYRRNQLKEIMSNYHPQPMSERLIQRGKQAAGLDEIIRFMKEDRFFSKNRGTLVDFYSWYGVNYALPHYERVAPLLQNKAKIVSGMVGEGFDIVAFMEKETGIKLKKKPEAVELLLNMRLIGVSGFSRDKDSLYTIRWNNPPEKIWAIAFNEFSGPFFRTFTGGWSFKLLAGKMKKDEALLTKFKEDVPYTWEGWIEKNLTEGFARYLVVQKGIAGDVGEGIYIFDREYAQALLKGFDAQKTSLEDFTVKYLKQKYDLGK